MRRPTTVFNHTVPASTWGRFWKKEEHIEVGEKSLCIVRDLLDRFGSEIPNNRVLWEAYKRFAHSESKEGGWVEARKWKWAVKNLMFHINTLSHDVVLARWEARNQDAANMLEDALNEVYTHLSQGDLTDPDQLAEALKSYKGVRVPAPDLESVLTTDPFTDSHAAHSFVCSTSTIDSTMSDSTDSQR